MSSSPPIVNRDHFGPVEEIPAGSVSSAENHRDLDRQASVMSSFARGFRHRVGKLKARAALSTPPLRNSGVDALAIDPRQKGKQKDADDN